MQSSVPSHTSKPGKALVKLVFLALIALAALMGCLQWIDQGALDTLKHSLNATTIILLVVIINLMSFVLFLLFYTAWQWVRNDLKPPRPETVYSDSDKS